MCTTHTNNPTRSSGAQYCDHGAAPTIAAAKPIGMKNITAHAMAAKKLPSASQNANTRPHGMINHVCFEADVAFKANETKGQRRLNYGSFAAVWARARESFVLVFVDKARNVFVEGYI